MQISRNHLWAGSTAVASVGALAAAVLVGVDHPNPAHRVNLLSGAAWLPSSQAGQVTLLDGSSAEVAAQVKVADPGAAVDVVQQGVTAYAINHSTGTITRVDGATFDHSTPATPIPDAHAGLTAFAGTGPLYALDTQRGVLVAAEPRTLARLGEPHSLAARLSTGSATMDSAGRLWLIDQATGDLTRVAGGKQTTHRGAAKPGNSVLTTAGDNPVVVDITDRKAIRISPDAVSPDTAVDLDLAPGDTVQASGSPHGQHLYVVSSRGVLTICDLAAALCDTTVPIGAPATKFGAAVEAGNRVFVPDYTGGRVWIVDLVTHAVVAKPQVLPPGQFQLLAQDGVVFFNDPNSEKAGIVRIDGGIRNAAKYDPADPNKGLNAPPDNTSQGNPASKPSTPPPSSQVPPPADPNQPVNTPTVNQPTNPNQPPGPNQPTNPGQPTVPTQPTQPTNPTQPPPTRPKPQLGITVSKANPVADETITLKVTNSTGGISSARWNFGDGKTGTGDQLDHAWTAAGTFQVSVQVTASDGQQGSTSLSVTVQAKPTPKHALTVSVNGTGGHLVGGPFNCPPTCTADVAEGSSVTFTAQPDSGRMFSAWDPGCTSTGGSTNAPTCTVTMGTSDRTAGATFVVAVTLTISVTDWPNPPNGLIVGGGINCGSTCSVTVPKGRSISLTANNTQDELFGNWTSCPDGSQFGKRTCTYPMDRDYSDTADYYPNVH